MGKPIDAAEACDKLRAHDGGARRRGMRLSPVARTIGDRGPGCVQHTDRADGELPHQTALTTCFITVSASSTCAAVTSRCKQARARYLADVETNTPTLRSF